LIGIAIYDFPLLDSIKIHLYNIVLNFLHILCLNKSFKVEKALILRYSTSFQAIG